MNEYTICQDCHVNPSTYGDGVSWGRCSSCQYKFDNAHPADPTASQPAPVESPGIEHVTQEGLVSIIMPVYIVNYSLFHYTGNAIGSIREHTDKKDYELIIVDDGSPLKPPENKSYYADKVIVNVNNEGVTKSWNRGIRASFGEYVCLINNDIQVFDGWLEDMKECLNNGLDLVMSYPMYSLTEPFARAVEAKARRDAWKDKPITESFSDFKDFACVMMKKSLLNELGLFDEAYKTYISDVDFLERMTKAGKKFGSCKRVATSHLSDATGYAVPETPEIMNKDKEVYENRKKQTNSEATASPNQPEQVQNNVSDTNVSSNPKNLIRSDVTGDKLFLVIENKTHWITSPEVLKGLGFDFGQDRSVDISEFRKFIKGEPITMENIESFKNA